MAKKILIVEDEKDPKTFLELLFKESGYETATAPDGKTAMPIARDFKPDLITLDLIMPEQSGIKFYRDLIKDPELTKIPVIIISGATRYTQLFGRDHATMPKPLAFMEKPIDQAELLAKIKEAIG